MKLHLWPKWLLFLANGFIWGIPGNNLLNIGIHTWKDGLDAPKHLLLAGLALLTFIAFLFMFRAIVLKNIKRIEAMEEDRIPFWDMMPLRTWIVLAFMIALGITLKVTGIAPAFFTAFFYCGLGTALALAGIRYFVQAARQLIKTGSKT